MNAVLSPWLVAVVARFRGYCGRRDRNLVCELPAGHSKRCVARVGRNRWRAEF